MGDYIKSSSPHSHMSKGNRTFSLCVHVFPQYTSCQTNPWQRNQPKWSRKTVSSRRRHMKTSAAKRWDIARLCSVKQFVDDTSWPVALLSVAADFIKAFHKAREEPTNKYATAQTESQEIGWISSALVKELSYGGNVQPEFDSNTHFAHTSPGSIQARRQETRFRSMQQWRDHPHWTRPTCIKRHLDRGSETLRLFLLVTKADYHCNMTHFFFSILAKREIFTLGTFAKVRAKHIFPDTYWS